MTPTKKIPTRVRVIEQELNRGAAEYLEARDIYVQVRTRFEAICMKFGGVRELAAQVMGHGDFVGWLCDHEEVQFVGTPIGEAIYSVLYSHAEQCAQDALGSDDNENTYVPFMDLDGIVEALEAGGFEFKSATPRREVNAALMQLKKVKSRSTGFYEVENAEQIFEGFSGTMRKTLTKKG